MPIPWSFRVGVPERNLDIAIPKADTIAKLMSFTLLLDAAAAQCSAIPWETIAQTSSHQPCHTFTDEE